MLHRPIVAEVARGRAQAAHEVAEVAQAANAQPDRRTEKEAKAKVDVDTPEAGPRGLPRIGEPAVNHPCTEDAQPGEKPADDEVGGQPVASVEHRGDAEKGLPPLSWAQLGQF